MSIPAALDHVGPKRPRQSFNLVLPVAFASLGRSHMPSDSTDATPKCDSMQASKLNSEKKSLIAWSKWCW